MTMSTMTARAPSLMPIDSSINFDKGPPNTLNHMPLWASTSPHTSTFHSFPPEILHIILEGYRPVYDPLPLKRMMRSLDLAYENPPYNEYRATLRTYANLRLVSRMWYNFITPQLYASFVLSTYPPEDFERDSKAFLHRPDLIDRLVIRRSGREAMHRLAACLEKCTNLQTLDILDAHYIFWHQRKKDCYNALGSIPRTAPLRSLLLRFTCRIYKHMFPISIVLLGLGPLAKGLKELWLCSPCDDQPTPKHLLKLPAAFPSLEKLYIKGCLDPTTQLPKLLSRIQAPATTPGSISYRKPPESIARLMDPDLRVLLGSRPSPLSLLSPLSTGTTPLRSLSLDFNQTENTPSILLHALGSHPPLATSLTSLRIRTGIFYRPDHGHEQVPYTILRTCLNLHTFLVMTVCSMRIVKHLERHENLRVWGTVILPKKHWSISGNFAVEMAIAGAEDFVEIVRKVGWRRGGEGGGEGKGLKKLVLEWPANLGVSAADEAEQAAIVEKACRGLGVEFAIEDYL